MLQFECKGRKKLIISVQKQSGKMSPLLFGLFGVLGLQGTGWGPSVLVRAIYITQLTDSDVNLTQNTLTGTFKTAFHQISGHFEAQTS